MANSVLTFPTVGFSFTCRVFSYFVRRSTHSARRRTSTSQVTPFELLESTVSALCIEHIAEGVEYDARDIERFRTVDEYATMFIQYGQYGKTFDEAKALQQFHDVMHWRQQNKAYGKRSRTAHSCQPSRSQTFPPINFQPITFNVEESITRIMTSTSVAYVSFYEEQIRQRVRLSAI